MVLLIPMKSSKFSVLGILFFLIGNFCDKVQVFLLSPIFVSLLFKVTLQDLKHNDYGCAV